RRLHLPLSDRPSRHLLAHSSLAARHGGARDVVDQGRSASTRAGFGNSGPHAHLLRLLYAAAANGSQLWRDDLGAALDVLVHTALARRHVARGPVDGTIAPWPRCCAGAVGRLGPVGDLSHLESLDPALDLQRDGALRPAVVDMPRRP